MQAPTGKTERHTAHWFEDMKRSADFQDIYFSVDELFWTTVEQQNLTELCFSAANARFRASALTRDILAIRS